MVAFILANAMYLQLMERKVLAHMQGRLGPMRTGWHGILQPIADAVKFIMKEDIIPAKADKWVFSIAPIIMLAMAFGAFVAIPFGPPTNFYGLLPHKVPLWVANLNIGVLYILASFEHRHLRRDHGRVGLEQQVFPHGRVPFGGADDQL